MNFKFYIMIKYNCYYFETKQEDFVKKVKGLWSKNSFDNMIIQSRRCDYKDDFGGFSYER